MVLGSPNVAFGVPGTETGRSPKASQFGGAAAACCDAHDIDASPRSMASVVASLKCLGTAGVAPQKTGEP